MACHLATLTTVIGEGNQTGPLHWICPGGSGRFWGLRVRGFHRESDSKSNATKRGNGGRCRD